MQYYTTREAATLLGVKAVTIRKAVRQGRLTAKKFGHIWMILNDAHFHRFTPGTPGRPRMTGPDDPAPSPPIVSEGIASPSCRIERYKRGPYFAVYEGENLLCVTVYRRGAEAVRKRLASVMGVI